MCLRMWDVVWITGNLLCFAIIHDQIIVEINDFTSSAKMQHKQIAIYFLLNLMHVFSGNIGSITEDTEH